MSYAGPVILNEITQNNHQKYLITKRIVRLSVEWFSEPRKQSMAWMEADYSKHFR